jgi:tungstate transport system substrate-binding protein
MMPFFYIPIITASQNNVLRLATTTSVDNSGLLKYLLPYFIKQHPYDIKIIAVGSGKALRMARMGDADVVLVHSPDAENRFVDEGFGINRQDVMKNDYVLVGPGDDQAGVRSATSLDEALARIVNSGNRFISRGDDSGTHRKELSLWKNADIDPFGTDWYIETGTNMVSSLRTAEEMQAYILIDRATFLTQIQKGFSILYEDRIKLSSTYNVIAANPQKNKGVNADAASSLISWLTSADGQTIIAAYSHNGQPLYMPTRLTTGNSQ